MQPHDGEGPPAEAVAQAMQLAHALVAQGQPLQALRVVAELLRAVGLERQAGESVSRVQQALAAGSASAAAADELAGLLSLVTLQAQPAAQESSSGGSLPAVQQQQHAQQQQQQQQQQQWSWQQQQQQQWSWQQQQQQQQQACSGPEGMEVEGSFQGGTGPGPPATGAGEDVSRLGRLAAAAEGPSYVCPRCGGVVALARQEAHEQMWCTALHGS